MIDNARNIAFFGSPLICVYAFEELVSEGIVPSVVVTNPDRPQGRSLQLQSTPVKQWAIDHKYAVFEPESIKSQDSRDFFMSQKWDLFVVVAYGALMPQWLIELPLYKTLNLHPSLLPSLRGASPIRTALLEDMSHTGVTVMLMDEKMDHGPILAQEPVIITEQEWPMPGSQLDELLAKEGGKLLAKTIPQWINGSITPREQDHARATYSSKIIKSDGELILNPHDLPTGEEAYQTYLKICAYDLWPGTFFMYNNKRIKINEASLHEGKLSIESVTPEGKNRMGFAQFLAQQT